MIKLFVTALAIVMLTSETQAQAPHTKTSTPTVLKTGSVDGRVFGITHGGDLKPARMPTIYLLYEGQREKHLEENSADYQYQLVSLDALGKRLENPSTGDENLKCRESMLDHDRTLLDVAQWALDNKKAKQVFTTEGDEEGRFSITKVPVGYYRIVARGQAGASDAYWESMFIAVKVGARTSVKLMKPGKSCLNVE
jgi:hypothetical protein